MEDILLDEVYIYWLDRTMKSLKQQSQIILNNHGFNVTVDQWVILKKIHDVAGSSQVAIAESTYKNPASITRIIDSLVKKDLAERRPSPNDRRRYGIFLTEQGQKLYQAMLPVILELRKHARQDVTDEELMTLKQILDKIYNRSEYLVE